MREGENKRYFLVSQKSIYMRYSGNKKVNLCKGWKTDLMSLSLNLERIFRAWIKWIQLFYSLFKEIVNLKSN